MSGYAGLTAFAAISSVAAPIEIPRGAFLLALLLAALGSWLGVWLASRTDRG